MTSLMTSLTTPLTTPLGATRRYGDATDVPLTLTLTRTGDDATNDAVFSIYLLV